MLKNAHWLAKFGADTAENQRNFAENLPIIGNYPTGRGSGRARPRGPPPSRPRRIESSNRQWQIWQNWQKVSQKFCKLLAGSLSAVSKRKFARKYAFDSILQVLQDMHTFKISQKISLKNQHFSWNFRKNCKCRKICKICQISKNSVW